jgi:hypothetical protein
MDTQLVATDPHQMAQAQYSMMEFCDAKIASLQTELVQAHGIIEALRTANMSDARGLRKREAFYVKVKAALAEGYYILPPIPHQTFAIRTAREQPPTNPKRGDGWRKDEVAAQSLPAGEGEYRNAEAVRDVVDTYDQKNNAGAVTTYNIWGNVAWKDVEFPFFPVKPQIIEATSRALSRKVFDWLGVAPQYRSVDPMVIGCIKHWKPYAEPLHFFVAWWLDVDTL